MGFGKNASAERRRQNRRLEDIAYHAGITAQHLALLEREIHQPRLETANAIARALGVDLSALNGETVNPAAPCARRR